MTDDDPRLAAVRRINRALQADHDRAMRALGIDTSKQRPLVDSLPGLQAQLASRHDLPLRVVADILDEVVPMLELLARVHAIVEKVDEVAFSEAGEHEHAVAVIDAIRATLAEPCSAPQGWALGSDIPDGPPLCAICGAPMQRISMTSCGSGSGLRVQDICLECSPLGQLFRRRERRTLEQDVHDAVERGEVDDDHVMTESALVETTPLAVASYPGERDALVGFLECKGCAQPFPAADAHQLRVEGKPFAFHPGQFCPDCAAKYERGELVRPD